MVKGLDLGRLFAAMDDGIFSPNPLEYFSNANSNLLRSFDEIERIDNKLPEVIYIEDSPLVSRNGETPTITPCSSVHEEDDTLSIQEVFLDDTLIAVANPKDSLLPESSNSVETSSNHSSLSYLSSFSGSVKQEPTCPSAEDQTLLAASGKAVRDFTIPCLKSVHSLRTCFESKYELHLRLRKIARCNKPSRKNLYKFKKELYNEIDEWEQYLNEQSENEAYISVENTEDNVSPPRDFTYITRNIYHKDLNHLFDTNYLVGCSCERICTGESCDCPRNSGGVFAYDRNGRVCVNPGTPIYECNSRCPCGMSCRNRVLQRGRTVKVAIFRTPSGCGWGVKTMEPIEKHQLVTEYVGEAITQEEAERRGKIYDSCGQTYLFDLDFNDGECLYTLDAKTFGNISHFINHSCNPNLDVYAVWVDTLDPNIPRIAFFANRRIMLGEELTFDYQMTVSEVGGSSLSPRKKERIKCHCGSSNCRKYLY